MTKPPRSISFRALKIRQPVGDFYVGVMPCKELCEIAFADVRRLEKQERDVETYLGIQRPLSLARVEDIKRYVRIRDASFPTSIILAVKGVCAAWDEASCSLTLKEYLPEPNAEGNDEEAIPFQKIAKILDGQHRLAGLEGYDQTDFELNVAIFVDIDIAEQANIFATVNLAQTKVNKSLVYDLFDLAKASSPQKACHNIAVALDATEGSPFLKKIKRLGVATYGRFDERITQATFVESLLPYFSSNPVEDRDLLFRGKRLRPPTLDEMRVFIFRELFINGQEDEISKIIWSYFQAVKERWPQAWESSNYMLTRTNGFRAFMRFLRPAYLNFAQRPGVLVPTEFYTRLFQKITLTDSDFNTDNFKPGAGGEGTLLRRLHADTDIPRQPVDTKQIGLRI